MAVLTRTKRDAKSAKAAKSAKKKAASAPMAHATEAPDLGVMRNYGEAPDTGRIAEAPDAGHGRQGYIEGEFTHGRSQS